MDIEYRCALCVSNTCTVSTRNGDYWYLTGDCITREGRAQKQGELQDTVRYMKGNVYGDKVREIKIYVNQGWRV